MPATTDSNPPISAQQLQTTQHRVHPNCVVCGAARRGGLKMNFDILDDGRVSSTFACEKQFEGYPGRLQGGVVASLIDGVMTNCLFAHGIVAVTAELTVRYRHPVEINTPATLYAQIEDGSHGFYRLTAELHQDGQLRAIGKAKFLAQPELDSSSA